MHSDCPTLFVVGAPKGGTTSMLEFVSMHPGFEGAGLRKKGFARGEIFYFTRHDIDMVSIQKNTFQLVVLYW